MSGKRSLITGLTFASLTSAFVLSWVWFADSTGSSRFEPAVSALGIIGAIIGVFADRQAARAELTRSTAHSVLQELQANADVLASDRFTIPVGQSPGPRVYPRLRLSAADAALNSGAIELIPDDRLLHDLHAWRDSAQGFNRRLDLTELRAFMVGDLSEIEMMEAAIRRAGGPLNNVHEQLSALRSALASAIQ